MALGVRFQKLREESYYQGRKGGGGGGVKFTERQGGAKVSEGATSSRATMFFCKRIISVKHCY